MIQESDAPPRTSTHVVIVGAGFAGIGAAAELKRQGIDDFVILERAAEVGGVWRDNNYPGCRCDIPSPLYSFSFLPKPDWNDRFATQPEIKDYLAGCVHALAIGHHLRFNVDVINASWDPRLQRWSVKARDGRIFDARMLIVGSGALNEPVVPDIEGLASFGGDVFHSAQWPADFDPTGRRIVVIGTGASAVQLVPEIAKTATHVTVFQRTAPWIVPRGDHTIPGWLKSTYGRFPAALALSRHLEYYRRELMTGAFVKSGRLLGVIERAGLRHIRRQVNDPRLRRMVTPNFRAGCKRVLMSDDWYPTLVMTNVDLITDPIERIVENFVRVGDSTDQTRDIDADTVILATGFHVQRRSILASIRGVGGQSAAAVMGRSRPSAYLGSTLPGFPNMVLMTGPNTGLANNSMVVMIEAQATYAASMAARLADHPGIALDVTQEALDRFTSEVDGRLAQSVWESGGCASWYQDSSGRVTALWPGTTREFRRRTSHLDLADYRVVPLERRN